MRREEGFPLKGNTMKEEPRKEAEGIKVPKLADRSSSDVNSKDEKHPTPKFILEESHDFSSEASHNKK